MTIPVIRSYNTARDFDFPIQPLAKQGNPDAAFYLGVMYNEGTGTVIDNKAARKWLYFSATNGNVLAPVEYSVLLKLGHGGVQDKETSTIWMQRGYELLPKIEEMAWSGDGFAQIVASYIYGKDNFDGTDEKKSLFWEKQAAKQMHPQGLLHLGAEYVLSGLEKKDKEGIAQGMKLLRTGADNGYSWSQKYLAYISFLDFDDVGVDETEARELASKAFENGLSKAGVLLGRMSEKGFGTDVDLQKAESIYLSAFKVGDNGGEAAYRLAMLKLGSEDEDRLISAANWLEEANSQGFEDSGMLLANMYSNGEGIEEDKARAAELYIEAAESGNVEAQTIVGDLFTGL